MDAILIVVGPASILLLGIVVWCLAPMRRWRHIRRWEREHGRSIVIEWPPRRDPRVAKRQP